MDNKKTINNTIDLKRVYCNESICIVEYNDNKKQSSDTSYTKIVTSDSDIYVDVVKIYNSIQTA